MSTPRGGQYALKLPDGTQVWLNSASSITYPTAFTGNERTVSITGEAYFEVMNDKSKPFHVMVNDMDVLVLGTHFNINSYQEERAVRTTLLEGSVKISQGASTGVILTPGQQAKVEQQQIKVINGADLEQVMAWKNGLFNFNKLSLEEIIRQLSRWYDVDVVYQGTIAPKKFGGEIERDLNLLEVLDVLKEAGVHFSIEGKRLIVMP
jgi:ferric-dicitrate binding protein FerR (iron transport regulator)